MLSCLTFHYRATSQSMGVAAIDSAGLSGSYVSEILRPEAAMGSTIHTVALTARRAPRSLESEVIEAPLRSAIVRPIGSMASPLQLRSPNSPRSGVLGDAHADNGR